MLPSIIPSINHAKIGYFDYNLLDAGFCGIMYCFSMGGRQLARRNDAIMNYLHDIMMQI